MVDKKKIKSVWWIFLTVFISAGIRLVGINKVLFTDELAWAIITQHRFMSVFTILPLTGDSWFFPHPPLGPIPYLISTSLFGLQAWSMRLVPILFGIGTIITTYLLAKKLYGKKPATISAILMGISFWHILASIQVDIDGAVLAFLFTAFFYCLIRYEEEARGIWMVLTGLALGTSFLTKYAAIFLPIIAASYVLIKKKNIWATVRFLLPVLVIGGAIFMIFPLVSLIFEKGMFLDTLMWGSKNTGRAFSLRPFIYLLFYATPLLFVNAALSLLKPRKQDVLPWLWILVPFAIYMVFLGSATGPFERYLMVIIPALSMLGGRLIADLRLSKRQIILAGVIFILVFTLLLAMNLGNARYLAHDPGQYIKEAISLKWDFNFPYVGSSGPQFWLVFSSMAIPLILSLVFAGLYLIARMIGAEKLSKTCFAVFLGVALAFNMLLVQEYLFGFTHPSPERATLEFVEYYKENPLPEPVYSTTYQQGFYFYTNLSDSYTLPRLDDENLDLIQPVLEERGGSVVLIDFPGFSREAEYLEMLAGCDLANTFSDKNKTLVYVYRCEPGMIER